MAIEPPRRFFFYGTLIGGGPAPVQRSLRRLCDLGPARAGGLLYAILDPEGWYPAMIEGAGQVAGRLYQALGDFDEADLAALDTYENYDPADPQASLYCRAVAEVAGQAVELYRFNQSLPDEARPIVDGDFAAWVAFEGVRSFGR